MVPYSLQIFTYLALFLYGRCVAVDSSPPELGFQEFEEFSGPSMSKVSMIAEYSVHLLGDRDVRCGGLVCKHSVQKAV